MPSKKPEWIWLLMLRSMSAFTIERLQLRLQLRPKFVLMLKLKRRLILKRMLVLRLIFIQRQMPIQRPILKTILILILRPRLIQSKRLLSTSLPRKKLKLMKISRLVRQLVHSGFRHPAPSAQLSMNSLRSPHQAQRWPLHFEPAHRG